MFTIFFFMIYSCFATSDLDFLAQFLPSNPVIVEAGAHDGSDTIRISRFWPQGTIYAFEPRLDVYERLCERIKNCQNITTWPIALGNSVGYADFYLSSPTTKGISDGWEANSQSSLLPPLKENWPKAWDELVDFSQIIKVNITTLDNWAKENHIEKIDFLWLDMQGSECQMLKASPQLLQTVKVIKTEISRKALYKDCILFPEYKQWLEKQGFICIQEDNGFHGDAIFIRKEMKR
jgi:2-O-methyltransferase